MLKGLKIAFIGWGNMATAMIGRLLDQGMIPSQIVATGRDLEHGREIARLGVVTSTDNAAALAADVIIVAVGHGCLPEIYRELGGKIPPKSWVISIVNGGGLASLAKGLCHERVIRAMPNIAARHGEAISGWKSYGQLAIEEEAFITSFLQCFGPVVELWEPQFPCYTANVGCSTATLAALIRPTMYELIKAGFDEGTARLIVAQILRGEAAMLLAEGGTPEEIIRHVATTGGSTEKIIKHLQEQRVFIAISDALEMAAARSRDLEE